MIDLDATTLVTAHSAKQAARPTFKQGFGFHPLLAFLDRGNGTGEALAGVLRPGDAGSNTAADHLAVLGMALAALPRAARDRPVLVRTDAAGATHAFVDELTRRGLQFSVGFDLTEPVRQAILAVGEDHWRPAIDTDDHQCPGGWVGELATLDLAGWPQGTRAICRRERPHPAPATR